MTNDLVLPDRRCCPMARGMREGERLVFFPKAAAVFVSVGDVVIVKFIDSVSVLLGVLLAWLPRPGWATAPVSSLLAAKEVSDDVLALAPAPFFLNMATSFLD